MRALAALFVLLSTSAAGAVCLGPIGGPDCAEGERPALGFELKLRAKPAVRKPVEKPAKPASVQVRPQKPAAKKTPAVVKPAQKKPVVQETLAPSWVGLTPHPVIRLEPEDMLPVPNRYIIRFDLQALAAAGIDPGALTPDALAGLFGIEAFQVRSVQQRHLPGFVADLTAAQSAAIAANPLVQRLSPDTQLKRAGSMIPWNLDRIDQPDLPLDNVYARRPSIAGARVYLLDSGVDATHPELTGRVEFGARFVPQIPADELQAALCTLHGTGMASLIAGKTMGVAPDTPIIDVSVLPCWEDETTTVSVLVEAFHWVLDRELPISPRRPSVVNLSLTGPHSDDLDEWITEIVENGIPVVTAAGNNSVDACSQSPASAKAAVTVAASGPDDKRPDFSNFGPCVDIRAPGVDVTSASSANHGLAMAASGTSASSAIVSGIVAANIAEAIGAKPADNLVTNGADGAPEGDLAPDVRLVQAEASIRFDCRVADGVNGLDLREFPGKNAPVTAQLKAGSRIELLGKVNDWIKVTTGPRQTGWASLSANKASSLLKAREDAPCQ